ncbi:ferredoxin reductase family protein [Nakamurella sp. GG22]
MTVTGRPTRSAPAVPLTGDPGRRGHRRRQVIAAVVIGLAITGLAFVVALWFGGGGIDGFSGRGGWETEIGRLTGLIASYLLLIQVLLMARIPWLESIWGQDVLARQHRLVGFASFDLMLAHIVLIVLGYAAAADSGVLAEFWQLLTIYPGILLAAAGTVALIAVVVTSIRVARRSLRYESWHLIHLYAYLGVGLALPHQLWTGADFVGSPLATAFWWALWGATAAALVLWRVVTPVVRSLRHDIRVLTVVRESADVLSIVMSGHDLDRLGLRAGQFCQWRFLGGPGWTRAHPFTVSAVPTSTRLRITVRTSGDGTRALTTLRPGSRVLIEGPYGVMDPARRRHRDVLLIAAGVGVTTMRGIAEAVLAEPAAMGHRGFRRPSVVVLHRIRSGADALFVREFGQLAAGGHLRGFSLVGHRSEVSGWWGGDRQVDPAAALTQLVPDLSDREIYLCGPGPWMTQVKQTLGELKIPSTSVHAEEFAW